MMYDTSADPSLAALFKRRWRVMALTSGLVLAAGIPLLLVMPKSFESSAKLLVMRTEQRFGGLGIVSNALPELGGTSQPLFTQVEMIRLPATLRNVIEKLDLRNGEGKPMTTDELAKRIRVAPIKGTDLIEVSYRDSDPHLAQQVVQNLCEFYLQNTESTRREGVQAGLKIVDEHMGSAQSRLSDAETRLREFKQTLGSVSLNQEIQASVRDMGDLNTLIRNHQLALESLQAKAASLRSRLRMSPREAQEAAALAQNPRLRALQEQLVTAETSPLRTQGLAASHPDLMALESRIAMLKQDIGAEIRLLVGRQQAFRPLDDIQIGLLRDLTSTEVEIMATKASISAAERSRSSLSASMTQLPAHEMTLERLQREVVMAGQIYQDLLQKREQARQHLSIAPSFAQVVQAPEIPERPLIPLGGQAGSVLLLASLAAGFGAGTLRDVLDRRVSPTALAGYMPDIPIFCSLPLLSKSEKRQGELIVTTMSSPAYLQSLMTLGLALENHLGGFEGQVIVMTSTSTGEGKSMTIANLALSLRDMGKRVLLVDGDLRRPRLHTIFGENDPGLGLSEALLNRLSPAEAVREKEGIHLVSAGSAELPFKQAKLRTQLAPLLSHWRKEFDVILIDLPPLSMVAEVAQVAKQADGTLFLGNFQKVGPEALLAGVQMMQAVGIPILGALSISPFSSAPEASYYLVASEGDRP